ncbi:MAG TPA: hypothetical protein VJU81_18340 [Methylomirabilota bacterium]|nr:hypothetical protein [Methylomirabilota bacterium]
MTRILDPTLADAATPAALPRALRPRSLRGLTVGLLANGKSNGMALLDGIAVRLSERHGIGEVVRVAKTNASAPVSERDAEGLAKRCAVVITAIGD